jgi:exodeoxyribonuclease V alpha subunit
MPHTARPTATCVSLILQSRSRHVITVMNCDASPSIRVRGCEYPAVIIPVLTQHHPMLQRNLLYTGVTRGKRVVVLVGQKKAIAIAVRNVSGRRRWSKLDEWLRLGAPSRSSKKAELLGRL